MSAASHRFVLVHSPLVGPGTWVPVAHALRGAGAVVVVPTLDDGGDGPYWERHVRSLARQVPLGRPVVLVAHSGAGALLGPLPDLLESPVAAAVFVDAGLPAPGASRLDVMAGEDAGLARELRRHLEAGGRFPAWTDDDLAPLVPDDDRRRELLQEVRPRALDFFTEPIPAAPAWPEIPCAYIQLSDAYAAPAAVARAAGWPFEDLGGGHFAMLRDPDGIAEAIRRAHRMLTEA